MRNIVLILFLFLITASFLGCKSNNYRSSEIIKSQDEEIVYPLFDQYFESLENFSGNVLVALHGKPIYKRCFGYANIELEVENTIDTKFRIGSITKQFTSMAIMILQERSHLNVNDKISDHLSDIPESWHDITIHQLLTHTSGIMHSWALEGFGETMMLHNSIEKTIDRFRNQPLIGEPGEKFEYSGVGYFILSLIIESASGKSYEIFLEEEIFDKIGMMNSGSDDPKILMKNRTMGYETDSTGTYNSTYIFMPILMGGGNLYSTLDDLLVWDRAILENALISEQAKAEMFTPELENYAYGWVSVETDSLILTSHTGGVPGFRARIDRYPIKDNLVVILSNNIRVENPEIRGEFSKLVLEEFARNRFTIE